MRSVERFVVVCELCRERIHVPPGARPLSVATDHVLDEHRAAFMAVAEAARPKWLLRMARVARSTPTVRAAAGP